MTAALRTPLTPRYGSAAELAAYSGLSVKTVRRFVDSGKVRGLKVGRRLLIPFEDLDRHVLKTTLRPKPREATAVATIHSPTSAGGRYVPPADADEQAHRSRGLAELLDSWEADGDEQEQRETLEALRESHGPRRVASSRPLFPS